MRTKRKSRNPHMAGLLLDLTHVVLCVGVVVFAVLIFLNPDQHRRFFPIVFILAALMQFLHGVPKVTAYHRSHNMDKSLLAAGIGICILGVILALLAAGSAITIWR